MSAKPGLAGVTLSIAALTGLLAITACITTFPARAEPASSPLAEAETIDLVSVLSRMTLVVKDADVSKRFYTYALGYEEVMDRVIDRESVRTLMGLEADQTVRFVIVGSSHVINDKKREGAGIGLIQVGNPAPPVMTRPGASDLASGEAMMAVRTSDIDTVYQRLLELDAKILIPPMKSADGLETELVVHDPDGIRIHVVQRPDREP